MLSLPVKRLMVLLAVLCALQTGLFAEQPSPQHWITDYGTAYHQAEKEGKSLLVVFERPGSKSSLLRGVEAVSGLGKHYVLCRVDGTTETGRDLAQKFRTPEIPSLVITDDHLRRVTYRQRGPLSGVNWEMVLVSAPTDKESSEESKAPRESKPRGTICYT